MTVKAKIIIGCCAFSLGLIGSYIWSIIQYEKREIELKQKFEKEKRDLWKETLQIVNTYEQKREEQKRAAAEKIIEDQLESIKWSNVNLI